MGRLRRRLQPPHVVVYTRSGCGLCRTAERLARAESPGLGPRVVDIDADAQLQRLYHIRVPVIEVDGHVVAEAQVGPGTIARAVRAARLRRLLGDIPPEPS